MKKLTTESPLFLIPVLADGNIITDLEVMLVNGDWKIVSIGGHVCKKVIAVLTENGLKESECKIIFSPTQKVFISYKDGEEIGLPYMNDNDSLKMTQLNVKELKEQLMQNNTINANPNLAPEQVRFGNTSMFQEQKQTTSILLRLTRFIRFQVQRLDSVPSSRISVTIKLKEQVPCPFSSSWVSFFNRTSVEIFPLLF